MVSLAAVAQRQCLLGVTHQDLHLDFTLPTGQSFRWRKTGDPADRQYTGCIGARLIRVQQGLDGDGDVQFAVLARGADAPAEQDAAVLRDYFNLGTSLPTLMEGWVQRDARFLAICPFFPGARMLRQDPVECLFQFICSSNNHISRIHGMVERLCSTYGTRLVCPPAAADDGLAAAASSPPGSGSAAGNEAMTASDATAAAASEGGPHFYAFPTLEQLALATEESLREAGFGYRAKFVTGSVKALLAKPGGGAAWLEHLRTVPYAEASAALAELPGVGPKVAACVCLFSLDKHEAIPVDTHVWQIAVRYYLPHLAGRALTKALHDTVAAAFVDRFGPYAGWAHNTLFISELASQRHRLPEHLRAEVVAPPGRKRKGAAAGKAGAAAAVIVVVVKAEPHDEGVSEAGAGGDAAMAEGPGPSGMSGGVGIKLEVGSRLAGAKHAGSSDARAEGDWTVGGGSSTPAGVRQGRGAAQVEEEGSSPPRKARRARTQAGQGAAGGAGDGGLQAAGAQALGGGGMPSSPPPRRRIAVRK